MTDQDGGIIQKILAITAPPNTATATKQRRSKQPRVQQPTAAPSTRQTGIDNRPYCEACSDGGDLLCCERCPSSFHFGCCDPPLDPLHLPEGEWVCQSCRPPPAHLGDHPNALFRPLLMQCYSENPMVFSLPEELMNMAALRDVKQERKLKQDPNVIKFCYLCNRSNRYGKIINCDFCPLSFHMDCLTPPITDKPISSSWMCPNHVEHKIAGLQDTRLSKRMEALEKCRSEVSQHAIKMDFIKSLNKIPQYHRRTNLRASNVPDAIKAMYREPVSSSHSVPCLSDLLMTATEELEILRRESRQERELMSKETSQVTLTTSNQQDNWTRHAILSQAPPTNQHQSTVDDLNEILGTESPPICNGFNKEDEGKSLKRRKLLNGYVETSSIPNTTSTQTIHDFVPDVSQLSSDLVRLLAEQRIKQLFSERGRNDPRHANGATSSSNTMPSIAVSSITNQYTKPSHQQSTSINKHDAKPLGIVCPISAYGPAHYLYKKIVTIGSSSNMDVTLTDYGYCNFISSYHACLILDKDSTEIELINYSEHGSIVDGVLYSCDFSDKLSSSNEGSNSGAAGGGGVLLLDDIKARGTGVRADKAKKRLDMARKCLHDKTLASKTLAAAFKLSKSVVKDFVPDPVTTAGIKRSRSFDEYNNETSASPNDSSPSSSIVSIPLSKTKKTTNHQINDKYSDKKKPSPDKKPRIESTSPSKHHTSSSASGTASRSCLCKRSASSLIGSGGKGWEGAATVCHGSKLRFGCIQLILSLSSKPGYNELQHALKEHHLI